MVDWAKKIQRHGAMELHPGEQIEAGTFVQPSGSIGRQVGFGVGGAIGAVATLKMGTASEASAGGDGATFPQKRAVLGLSSGRLMAFAHERSQLSRQDPLLQLVLSVWHEHDHSTSQRG